MKITMLAAMLGVSLCSHVSAYAQEKPKVEEKAEMRKDITSLRVQVVVTENEGEKKISSLPYTFLVNAPAGSRGEAARLRMGLRVPVATGAVPGSTQFQYQQVGTNLDCWAIKVQDGRFNLHLSVERSSVYSPSTDQNQKLSSFGNEVVHNAPVIKQLSSETDVLVRDGQTAQTTLATDPVSGRVTKLEVTVNTMK